MAAGFVVPVAAGAVAAGVLVAAGGMAVLVGIGALVPRAPIGVDPSVGVVDGCGMITSGVGSSGKSEKVGVGSIGRPVLVGSGVDVARLTVAVGGAVVGG